VLAFDDALLCRLGATYEDSDSLINIPLSARQVEAVALFKADAGSGELRVSLRSKGPVDVRRVAQRYGGGGHRNAAGFTAPSGDESVREQILRDVIAALDHVS
jgi:phosphoesterase RecJ-like protein